MRRRFGAGTSREEARGRYKRLAGACLVNKLRPRGELGVEPCALQLLPTLYCDLPSTVSVSLHQGSSSSRLHHR